MFNSEKINFVNGRQYKSISYIEKLNKNSHMRELDYEFSLNLQTKAKLSNVVNIYLSKEELEDVIVNPLKKMIECKDSVKTISKRIKNIIPPVNVPYYDLDILLPDSYSRNMIKVHGCTEYLNINFELQDKRFIKIETKISYKWLAIKHKPKVIQPKVIILSLDEAEDLIILIEEIFSK